MAGGIDATVIAAMSFATFLGGLIYLKVPAMVTKSLDDQSAKIAAELAEAKKLREEAQALRANYEAQRLAAEAHAETIVANAREDAARIKIEAEEKLEASILVRTQQASERIKRAEDAAIYEVRAAATDAAMAVAKKILVASSQGKSGEALISAGIAALPGRLS